MIYMALPQENYVDGDPKSIVYRDAMEIESRKRDDMKRKGSDEQGEAVWSNHFETPYRGRKERTRLL